ncbi:ABC transporter permease [Priestia endophytica]|uniref:ABC transporter permease n=1 Tax=Priestia endophytica TaxID=135735 RepID=UPI002E21BC98|nr:iron export ABC transporter permease subunit FetB [Priestia endophytica]
MDFIVLLFTVIFVFIALFLSKSFKIGIEKDIIIATIRASIQLLFIGYLLTFIFNLNNPFFTIIMILCMILVAAQNVVKKKEKKQGVFWKVLLTLIVVEGITQGLLLLLGIIPPTPKYMIPISGMIIGNSMVLASLFLNRLASEVEIRKEEVLLILSLGGSTRQAISHILKASMKASMIPTLESQKTIGLVQLPGMMTGQILAGADPVQAVRFQLLIVFTMMASATLTCVMLSFLIYPSLFTSYQQLKER